MPCFMWNYVIVSIAVTAYSSIIVMTLSVIGVEESNADAVRDCSYVKAIV